jgi:uncharacterized repeat protein (TIGR03803 family)
MKTPILLFAVLAVVFGFLITAARAFAASKEKVLYNFCPDMSCSDGDYPIAGLIQDTAGNLYGTTDYGGAGYNGTVFQLVPEKGKWKEKVLYSFNYFNGKDGADPVGRLIFDAVGNLYGTTYVGGSGSGCPSYGCGTVFQLTPGENGTWTEKVLYSFNADGKDGYYPDTGLIFDAAGNLYGTTSAGGTYGSGCKGGCGTVFQLIRDVHGKWTERVLYSFNNNDKGGYYPQGLASDAAGRLYGTAGAGGADRLSCGGYGCGTVFLLRPGKNGQWTEKVLHSFSGKDGAWPVDGLIFDAAGNLYDATFRGGAYGGGTVFQLMQGTDGKWTVRVLCSLNQRDGISPPAGPIFDSTGNLYGTTIDGGEHKFGTAFELSPGIDGKWTVKVLHSFNWNEKDGYDSLGGLIVGRGRNLYGTTSGGGAYNGGTVFEITP